MSKSRKKRFLSTKIMIFSVFIGLGLLSFSTIWATEPARPGEIERLKTSKEFQSRLDFVLKIGNHEFSPDMVMKYKRKIRELQGVRDFSPPGGSDFPSIGDVKIFALLIDFNDHPHVNDAAVIDDMLFGDGNPAQYPLESLTDYYDRSSYGLLNIDGSTLGWYTTAYDRDTIPTNATGRENLIKEVLNHYDGLGHDFSQYDNDGDGDIDYFVVMWAGPDTGWGTFWWGYQPGWTDSSYTLDGKKLTKYSWQWESNSPTVVIHETGHGLGLPDLYDYDPTVGPGTGVGGFDMMDSNSGDFNCFFKWMLDWLTPAVVSGSKQSLMLNPTATTTDAVLIWPGIGTGDIFSEFFMVQNRQDIGNDAGFWFAPDGLSIWHIDATLDSGGTSFVYNNSTTSHKLVRLMEADGLEEIEAFDCCEGCACQVADIGDLYNEGNRFSNVTFPSSNTYEGSESCVTVCDIVDHGGNAPISATFSTVCSLPPVCDIGGPYSAECQGVTTDIQLDGLGSFDPDFDDSLSYEWTSDCPGATFDDETSPTPVLTVDSSNGCSMSCNVSLTVTDCAGNSDTCSVPVTVQDTLPPEIEVTLNRYILWPPNHQLVDIEATVLVTDICDPNASFVLTSITSDEPDDDLGDGKTLSDIQGAEFGTPDTTFQLRAERSGLGEGRTYTIVYTAYDSCDPSPNHTTTMTVYVVVPHDRGK